MPSQPTAIVDVRVVPSAAAFTTTEIEQLQIVFAAPLMQRYLQCMLFNAAMDIINISYDDLIDKTKEDAVKIGFIKGQISALNTLINMDKPTPKPTPQ